ncbi:hypothetical protein Mp_4g19740 [Marchantia polymorpha subsp. ruderalis]|uniref:Uncharacterized protein n=2 Tax=Marchantia polymorpha TaxID=3197 RepID=A0AAF6BBQ4_MARPO|nr:hypothetical protein MARPO_0126s0020 [Marchantia polymorpha]BBN09438.1 hypothetical protein Mp_4g19740 [Marchantia polymorpha subsp. ruderalis]|eukprot:PTQ30305.1 hypothetical protein MARPO_0126s0020 [Marchantia polymorpha]
MCDSSFVSLRLPVRFPPSPGLRHRPHPRRKGRPTAHLPTPRVARGSQAAEIDVQHLRRSQNIPLATRGSLEVRGTRSAVVNRERTVTLARCSTPSPIEHIGLSRETDVVFRRGNHIRGIDRVALRRQELSQLDGRSSRRFEIQGARAAVQGKAGLRSVARGEGRGAV